MIRDLTGVCGAIAIAVGAGMVYRPAGVIVLGVQLVGFALFGFKNSKSE